MNKKIKCYNEKRPWGYFKRFTLNEKSTVKLIIIKPLQKLSLQSHKKRDELWIILDDNIIVEINNKIIKTKKNDEILIPKKYKHRIYSINNKENVRFIEIALGEFDENDETRYEDEYGRK